MSYIFENVTETVREPLLVLDADLRVRLANRAFYRIFHLQSANAVGRSVFELGNAQWNLPALRDLLHAVLTAGSSFDDFQVDHEFPEIGRRIMLLNARRIQDPDPASPMILLAIEDVTERREAEERLQELTRRLQRSNEELREFARAASHDLQEPLRKIQSFTDRIRSDRQNAFTPGSDLLLQKIDGAARRMQRLINDLLSLSNLDQGSHAPKSVDLAVIARETIADLENQIEDFGATVTIDSPLPAVRADPVHMRQLLLNLIGNSLKYRKASEPPRVRISGGRAEDPAFGFVRISDNGIGFEEKYRDRIFLLFQRLHRRDEYDGTGIGLAICRKIARRHGGEITACGKPGEGSAFTVTLPLA